MFKQFLNGSIIPQLLVTKSGRKFFYDLNPIELSGSSWLFFHKQQAIMKQQMFSN